MTGDAVVVPEDAAAAEERFLAELRQRVAWQAEEAERQRGTPVRSSHVDVLEAATLDRLVSANPDAPRAAEWRSFLGELRYLTDDQGRLPAQLERLVRVVFAELLEP